MVLNSVERKAARVEHAVRRDDRVEARHRQFCGRSSASPASENAVGTRRAAARASGRAVRHGPLRCAPARHGRACAPRSARVANHGAGGGAGGGQVGEGRAAAR